MGRRARQMPREYLWYDLETTGLNPALDQIVQVAMIRTDAKLNLKGGDLGFDVKLRPDVIPSPHAFAVHRIPVGRLMGSGAVTELEAAHLMRRELLSDSGSVAVTLAGYNNIRFDDVFLRNLFYRNLRDPYEHEWRSGNARMDIYRGIQLVRALAPEALKWPEPREDGSAGLTLERMAAANGVALEHAHDAGSDTRATLGLARAILDGGVACGKPWLWDYLVKMCEKSAIKSVAVSREPFWAVDSMLVGRPNHCALALPLTLDRDDSNAMWCLDLQSDIGRLEAMTPAELRDQLRRSAADRGVNDERPGVFRVRLNQMGMLAPVVGGAPREIKASFDAEVSEGVAERQGVDVAEMRAWVKSDLGAGRRAKLHQLVQDAVASDLPPPRDYAYGALYSGSFIDNEDREVRAALAGRVDEKSALSGVPMRRVQLTPLEDMLSEFSVMDRVRMGELALRAKWTSTLGLLLRDDCRALSSPLEGVLAAKWLLSRLRGAPVPEDERLPGDSALPLGFEGFESEMADVLTQADLDDEARNVLAGLDVHVKRKLAGLAESLDAFIEKHEAQAKVIYQRGCQSGEAPPDCALLASFALGRRTVERADEEARQAFRAERAEEARLLDGGGPCP